MPGDYNIKKYGTRPKVWVNDNDDSYIEKYFDTEEEAKAELIDLMLLAPFDMWELRDFGYTT